MSWKLVRLADLQPVPWHNGGGVTRELLAWPEPGAWTVRLSVAEVAQAGEFSQLAGVCRWFAVLSGEGVRLRTGGTAHELTRHSPVFEFDGGGRTDCELLGGATRDFNLMVRHRAARMWRINGSCARACKVSTLVALYANGQPATIGWAKEAPSELTANALAWRILDRDGQVQIAGADALWMEIDP